MPTRSPIGSEVRTLDMGRHATGAACPCENVCATRVGGAMVTTGSARLRAKLPHPVIDGDGHYVDLRQPFHAYVRDHGAGELLEAYNPFAGAPMSAFGKPWGQQTTEERHFTRNPAPPFWVPPGDTDYFATV